MQIGHALDNRYAPDDMASAGAHNGLRRVEVTPLLENAADDILQAVPQALAEAQAESRRRWLRLTPIVSVLSGLTGIVFAAAFTSGPGILLGLLPALPPLLVLWARMTLERRQEASLGLTGFVGLILLNLWPINLLGMVLGVVWADRPVNAFQRGVTAALVPAVVAQVPQMRLERFEDRPVIEPEWVLGSGLLTATRPEWRGENLLNGEVTLADGTVHPFMIYDLGVWQQGRPTERVFQGVVVQMQWLQGPLASRTWVNRHHGLDPASVENTDGLFVGEGDRFSGMAVLDVDDAEFSERFIARGRDLAEARRLLTPQRLNALVRAVDAMTPEYELSMVSWDESGWMTVALRGETPWLELLEGTDPASDRSRIARSIARLQTLPALLGAIDAGPMRRPAPVAAPAAAVTATAEEDALEMRPYRVRFHAA